MIPKNIINPPCLSIKKLSLNPRLPSPNSKKRKRLWSENSIEIKEKPSSVISPIDQNEFSNSKINEIPEENIYEGGGWTDLEIMDIIERKIYDFFEYENIHTAEPQDKKYEYYEAKRLKIVQSLQNSPLKTGGKGSFCLELSSGLFKKRQQKTKSNDIGAQVCAFEV